MRQSYRTTIKKLSKKQRFRKSKRLSKSAYKADKKIKTIAGRLVREIERKLSPEDYIKWSSDIEIFKKILKQKRSQSNKIYSIHEPQVECHSKGKEHKKYEFGNKVSILVNQKTGVIVGALSIEENKHDSRTIQESVEQYQRLTEGKAKEIYVDRGYRGISRFEEVAIKVAGKQTNISTSQKKNIVEEQLLSPK